MFVRLSQNIAGVTIMALGNGAPDIFSALAGIGQGRPELVFDDDGDDDDDDDDDADDDDDDDVCQGRH